LAVFLVRHDTEIRLAVVERVVVDMVNRQSGRRVGDNAVQVIANHAPLLTLRGIDVDGVLSMNNAPAKRANTRHICGVNQRNIAALQEDRGFFTTDAILICWLAGTWS